jgi:cephalosporin-C deacetylase-like acetyl esterase
MLRLVTRRPFVVTILLTLASVTRGQEIVATPPKAGGVYGVGEPIQWKVSLKGEGTGDVKQVGYVIKRGGLTVTKEGTIDLADGAGTLETSLDEPNTLLVELKAKINGKDVRTLVGAAAAPEKIQPSAPPPDDFDAFWKAKLDELAAVPVNAVVEPADAGKPTIEYAKVRMDNVRGTKIHAQLAKPKKPGEKFPALLLVQYAGVYPLQKQWVTSRAEKGWLTLNLMAHDLPIDEPADFYKKSSETTLKDYMAIGGGDRDTSYFLRMYLSCYRGADFLANHPDWDGQTLVVMGTSQGGQQAFVTAGLHPRVTQMIANVPAGCDVTAAQVGRAYGFPYWANYAKWRKDDKILETGRYYDAVHFAARVKCPAIVSLGMIDESCPPAGVFAACNVLRGPKDVIVLPLSDHKGRGNSQAEFYKRAEAKLRELAGKGKAEAAKPE